jgi:hypothetical protein
MATVFEHLYRQPRSPVHLLLDNHQIRRLFLRLSEKLLAIRVKRNREAFGCELVSDQGSLIEMACQIVTSEGLLT